MPRKSTTGAPRHDCQVHGVFLTDMQFHLPKKWDRDLPISGRVTLNHATAGDRLHITLRFELLDEASEPDFAFVAEFAACVSVLNEKPTPGIEQFAQVNAPAMIFPFVRELLANGTMRTSMGPLLMPMINFVAMAKHGESKRLLVLPCPDRAERSDVTPVVVQG